MVEFWAQGGNTLRVGIFCVSEIGGIVPEGTVPGKIVAAGTPLEGWELWDRVSWGRELGGTELGRHWAIDWRR